MMLRCIWTKRVALVAVLVMHSTFLWAQSASERLAVERATTGDAPADPGPLATDISGRLTHQDIRHVVTKVADWQLRVAEPKFNAQWTFAALYDGLLAASRTTGDPRYRDAVKSFAESRNWKLLDARFPHADDMALGQAYLDLYLTEPVGERKPEQIADVKRVLDRLVARPDDPAKDLWWWCDALFMAPPVLARMYVATGDKKYLEYMDREWDVTTGHLYNKTDHLYFRDSHYFTQKESNGRNLYWSRGNGWVLGALVKILEVLPKDDPHRADYVELLKEMCTELASIQSADGLWRSGLLNADGYDMPEVSGSSFFVYAMAYGVREGFLEKKHFMPVIEKGWSGLLHHVYADGRLGSIQPIDAKPGKFPASASSVFGVGGFLLAGFELDKLATK